ERGRRLPTEGVSVAAVSVTVLALVGVGSTLRQAYGLLGGLQSRAQPARRQQHVGQVLVADRGVLPTSQVQLQGGVAPVTAGSGGEPADIGQVQRVFVEEDRMGPAPQPPGQWNSLLVLIHHKSAADTLAPLVSAQSP